MVQPVFKILSTEHNESTIVTVLAIDADSDILKGHFPEQPVVPGACMLQTIKEILEDTFSASFRLIKADNIKFLNMVTPDTPDLTMTITYQSPDDEIKISAELVSEPTVFMKLQATFTER
jgi:3-hydroxyacyl-[acyl-carrier-protein] dehydratase